MNLRLAMTVAALSTLMAVSASAVPIVSGNYVLSYRSFCQTAATATSIGSDDGDIRSIHLLNGNLRPGDQAYISGIAKADPVLGTLEINGFREGGHVVQLTTDGGTEGSSVKETVISETHPFSNTSTTFTMDGTPLHAYFVVNGKTGIATFVELVGLQPGSPANCSQQMELMRK